MKKQSFSYQDKQRLIKHVANLYTREFVFLHCHNKYILQEKGSKYANASDFVGFVNDVLELLTKEHKQILVNDFFDQKDRSWWTEYYSKTTYYRIKSTAMHEFLHCLQ